MSQRLAHWQRGWGVAEGRFAVWAGYAVRLDIKAWELCCYSVLNIYIYYIALHDLLRRLTTDNLQRLANTQIGERPPLLILTAGPC